MRKDIGFRIGPQIKYSFTGVYYWNKSKKNCPLRRTILLDIGYELLFPRHIRVLIFYFSVDNHTRIIQSWIWRSWNEKWKTDIKVPTLVSGTLFWVLITGIVAGNSISNEFREEMCIWHNQKLLSWMTNYWKVL